MTENDNDAMPLLLANFKATTHQHRANALSLEVRQHGHRCKGQSRHGSVSGENVQIAERDVADHLDADLSNQRYRSVSAGTASIDQAGLGLLPECKLVYLPHTAS